MSRHPEVKWAQRVEKVYITVQLADSKDAKVDLTPDGVFTFSASAGAGDNQYELKLELFDKVNVEESKINVGMRSIFCVVQKAESEWWKRLLRAEGKAPHYVKVDWDKWVDEDENEGGEPDLGGMDFSKFGGMGDDAMGGLGGMGGMGGLGGMGGMGGLGGMGGMGGLGGMGGMGGMGGLGGMGGMGGMGGLGGMDFSKLAGMGGDAMGGMDFSKFGGMGDDAIGDDINGSDDEGNYGQEVSKAGEEDAGKSTAGETSTDKQEAAPSTT
ncbi:putative HSP20-like chaperone [Lupinus albus]|uniref:Co-chaperone protein p23 n=1 Tax=Lupinus albus TaxID=3870 RepID=A0A6A4PE57_LUPAL|nr:putative HSP20-like chaperone [Lupinus albus]